MPNRLDPPFSGSVDPTFLDSTRFTALDEKDEANLKLQTLATSDLATLRRNDSPPWGLSRIHFA